MTATQSTLEPQVERSGLVVALFTPFWGIGANLGDAVIVKAVKQCFVQQDAGVEFVGITLDPPSVLQSHDLPGMEMLGGKVYFFNYFLDRRVRGTRLVDAVRRLYLRVRHTGGFILAEIRHALRAARLLRRVQLLVIAGGGQLGEEWGGSWGLPYAEFKWTLIARLMGCRVAYLSVGVCKLESGLGRWFIRRALSRAFLVTLRDVWTTRFVEEKLGRRGGRTVPDAAFGLIQDVPFSAPSPVAPLRIGISPIAYGRAGVWPMSDPANAVPYLATLIEFSRKILTGGHEVVLFSTDSPDRPLVDEMRTALLTGAPPEWERRITVKAPDTADQILGILAPLDIVIASRLHGVILSHLMCRPVVAISYDRKVRAHMTGAGYERYCVELPGLTVAALESLYASVLDERAQVHEDLRVKTAHWRATLADQYATVVHAARVPQRPRAAVDPAA